MQALLWLQISSRKGATHVRIPVWAGKSKSKGFKQAAHAVFEQPKKLSHEAELALAPAAQSWAAVSRSDVEHAGCGAGARSFNEGGHPGTLAGQDGPASSDRGTHCCMEEHCSKLPRQFWQFTPSAPHARLVTPC